MRIFFDAILTSNAVWVIPSLGRSPFTGAKGDRPMLLAVVAVLPQALDTLRTQPVLGASRPILGASSTHAWLRDRQCAQGGGVSRCAARAGTASMIADYAGATTSLFANIRLPASIAAGALIPLGFGFALPAEAPPGGAFSPSTRHALIRLHRLVAVVSYSSLLACIVYSSISINSLAELPPEPAESVVDLIHREYELSWIATNVTFLLGLFGALGLVTLRVLLTFERDEGRVSAGFTLSFSLLMLHVIDAQVKLGDFSDSLTGLIGLYAQMMLSLALSSQDPLLGAALVCALASSFGAVSILAGSTADADANAAAAEIATADRVSQSAARLTALQADEVEVGGADEPAPPALGPQPDPSVVIGGEDGAAEGLVDVDGGATADGVVDSAGDAATVRDGSVDAGGLSGS